MQKSQPVGRAAPLRLRKRLVKRLAKEHHFAAKTLRRIHLRNRRVFRHVDQRPYAKPRRMISHALRVIARRSADHALSPLFGRHQQQLVQRATFLEAARHVQVFQLKVNRVAGERRKSLRILARRDMNRRPYPEMRGFDVVECDHAILL